MKHLAIAVLLLTSMASLTAQDPHTRQDTLRGSITPERAWWDLNYYDLKISVDPEARTISGSNTIRYQVLQPGQRIQIDLQDPLKIEALIEEIESEIDGFEAEVDSVLSESNAVTIIKV